MSATIARKFACNFNYARSRRRARNVVHTHVTKRKTAESLERRWREEDVAAVIGASIECAATREPIGRLFEMQILRLRYIPSCFAINAPRCTRGRAIRSFAGPVERAANLPGQRQPRDEQRACVYLLDRLWANINFPFS